MHWKLRNSKKIRRRTDANLRVQYYAKSRERRGGAARQKLCFEFAFCIINFVTVYHVMKTHVSDANEPGGVAGLIHLTTDTKLIFSRNLYTCVLC